MDGLGVRVYVGEWEEDVNMSELFCQKSIASDTCNTLFTEKRPIQSQMVLIISNLSLGTI